MKKIHLLIALLYFFFPITAEGGELVVYQEGKDLIRGYLPESWSVMTEDDLASLVSTKVQPISGEIETLAGYRLDGTSGDSAILFVLYANRAERVSWEERQKMLGWFKGNKDLMSGMLPENMQEFTLENIEYLQHKDTVLFETKVKVGSTELKGVNGVIFLRKGYLNIVGFATEGASERLNDFYSFIKTLSVSSGLHYTPKDIEGINRQMFQDRWQQILGGIIFLLVYGATFLKKDGMRLAGR